MLKMKMLQEFLHQKLVEMIEISINGNSEVIDLKIDDSLLEDKDSLQILLISCMNDVIKQSDENKKMLAMNMMGGLGSFGQK
jgi:nucleoid-associated protein EbfC